MKNNTLVTIIIVILIILGIWIYLTSRTRVQNNPIVPATQNNLNTQLFSSSPLSQNAHLISTPTYDAITKTALSGFSVTQTPQADGSVQYTLNAQNPEYQTQTYLVKPGEKLYFIDSLVPDDNGNSDANTKDDTAVVVDANGYIVGQ